ncbi:class I SAM-dependent methyltransferase [uncultured Ruegeria sp.]|uniref:class I SAM-dependent methyltransferase n=1 Tax=uncultured Ruegeria sp. TaxID=259304 RepID=UPI0026337497|nr:class I SAM-dependent methyltransferase [uncultured Ruegeria sp.]
MKEMDVYKAYHAHFKDGARWEDTPFYARVLREIDGGAVKWGCRDEEALSRRVNKDIPELYEDIAKGGFKSQSEIQGNGTNKLLASKYLADEVRVAIDRNGHFIAMDGRNRLIISRLQNLELIPVRVVLRHQAWADFKQNILDYAATIPSGNVYQKIDHPDLATIPATHVDDRLPTLLEAMKGYDAKGKTLIDIGTHWGAVSQGMAGLGFKCTAIESSDKAAFFAERITRASGLDIDVVNQNVFDFPDIEKADVIVVLNILHHFLKTERLSEQLTTLLKRMSNAEVILFQAHVSDPPGQMKNAFRNPDEAQFVAYIKEHTGIQNARSLGRARDGREMFILWRDGVSL